MLPEDGGVHSQPYMLMRYFQRMDSAISEARKMKEQKDKATQQHTAFNSASKRGKPPPRSVTPKARPARRK